MAVLVMALSSGTAQTAKVKVPGEAARTAALEIVREFHKAEYGRARTPDGKLALARKLLENAKATSFETDGVYVLLEEAHRLAKLAGDVHASLEAARLMGDRFAGIDALALQNRALAEIAASHGNPVVRAMVLEQRVILMLRAVDADRFDVAEKQAAVIGDGPESRVLSGFFKSLIADMRLRERSYLSVADAVSGMATDPSNKAFQRRVGEFRCFVANDWSTGLPHLADGDDARLAQLARLDLGNPTSSTEQKAVGDAWWEYAETTAAARKQQVLRRAGHWYARALQGLSGLDRGHANKRLGEVTRAFAAEFQGFRQLASDGAKHVSRFLVAAARSRYPHLTSVPDTVPTDIAGPGSSEPLVKELPSHYRSRATGRKRMRSRSAAAAIGGGLAWLKGHQDADGKWDSSRFMRHDKRGTPCDGPGNPTHSVGVTGLALLAFLADGSTMHVGPYKDVVVRGVRWLRKQQGRNGLFGTAASHDFIYDHAIAAYAMCEAFGMSNDPAAGRSAQAGLNYLESHRNPSACWRYQPRDNDNDISVTGWCIMAYETGRQFGLNVNLRALAICGRFLDELTDSRDGRCGYTKRGEPSSRHPGDHSTRFPFKMGEALTAVGLFCRLFLGQDPKRTPVLGTAAKTLLASPPRWKTAGYIDLYYWYQGSQAMRQMGGKQWTTWSKALVKALTRSQRKDGNFTGSWNPVGVWCEDGGRIYSTCMATLALQAGYRFGILRDSTPVPDSRRFSAVQTAWKSRNFTLVQKRLDALLTKFAELSEAERISLRAMQARLKVDVDAAKAEADRLRAGPDYLKARTRLREIAKSFSGLEAGRLAMEILKHFRTDLKIRRELRASSEYQRILSGPARLRPARIKKLLFQYRGTYAAKQAVKPPKSRGLGRGRR